MVASRLSRRQSLYTYVLLEVGVGLAALILPWELAKLTPLLAWAYNDGAPGLLFPSIRLLSCLLMVLVPAAALGATFPMAIRWFANDADRAARSSSLLYAANTTGAAVGALLAGFVLIPDLGLAATVRVGMAASALAAVSVLAILGIERRRAERGAHEEASRPKPARARVRKHSRGKPVAAADGEVSRQSERRWIAVVVLALSGFAALAHEIAWTRILSLVLGPTIYAFSATLAAVIAGVALGSSLGAWIVGRARRPSVWLAFALAAAAIGTSWTSSLAGGVIPRLVAQQMAASPGVFDRSLWQGVLLAAALILPTAACLGAAFPLALAIVSDPLRSAAGRFGNVYAINTVGAVLGSLAAGFVLIPLFGLQHTLGVVSGCLILATLTVVIWGAFSNRTRIASLLATTAAGAIVVLSPPWDRDLLASGAYLYAPFVPRDLDLETLLKAGTLLYYREGASSTVSVKRLTGTTTLAVDGKVDASNRSDMLTQKLIAHLPLLLHERPRDVAIVGLGSGVTVGAALRHPIERADVIEISPEVIEASRYFVDENQHALDDPRTHLIVGDGRSHLLLSERQYDVIISEPSNPWIAGVAALFTREFFVTARDRLAPGGIMCQWANAYNISDRDLRSIVATFASVFPDGSVWLVGGDDVLLVASAPPFDFAQGEALDAARNVSLDERLANIERHWTRPGVAADLASVSVLAPFSIWSLFVGGAGEMARYGSGAAILTDDRMSLEFSAPLELHRRSDGENTAALTALLGAEGGPATIRQARASARAVEWRHRAAMMAKSDAHATAYDDYVRALTLDPSDTASLDGLVRTAVASGRGTDALAWVKALTEGQTPTPAALIATSKLLASIGESTDAVEAARRASRTSPMVAAAVEQLASLFADAGDTQQLAAAVERLRQIAPDAAGTHYYAGVSALLHDQPDETLRLAERVVAIDPDFAPVYDLMGAAHTKLEQGQAARAAFEKSLRFDAHDSTAYTNLGLLELAHGNRSAAVRYFAEALWLAPTSPTAREGLARARLR